MLFAGKNRRKPDHTQEEKSLYPILHVAESLKEYQKELVYKEVDRDYCRHIGFLARWDY